MPPGLVVVARTRVTSFSVTRPPRRDSIVRSTEGIGSGDSGLESGGVRVRRTATAGGTARGRRLRSSTCWPTAETAAAASSVPSGDIEHAITRYEPRDTGSLSFVASARRLPTTRPRSPYVGSTASTSPFPMSVSLLAASSSWSVGVAANPRKGGTAGPLTIVRNAGSRAQVIPE